MSQEIEIEFKNMLTKEEFETLIEHFQIEESQFHIQHNHYFDTVDQQLRQLKSGLRIRQLENYNELTLKEPAKGIALTETTDRLSDEQVQSILIEGTPIPALEVEGRLHALEVSLNELQRIGTLSTTRAEINYNGGLLVFDHSLYADQEDYELEYEVVDEEEGKKIFFALLNELAIPVRPAQKKLARFMKALKRLEE
ncbi:adenylate cyclase [Kurthia zopfii]|uniref:Uncharacterized conserved protein n=1 Tax=Kurthia zopfii TaxID=1650 RepID=A0A8B4Q8S8_9BACL|nr:CYTH domain-containing protein [Kurthia zopfii]PWI21579.1 adenylate cyclase [Kurthia zopfii]TDR33810.1 uncharacterized protein YjbK [Kurthia zopfii]GEK31987.1 adenylate cyclase [Kurthia zopfii]STX08870.1 Uncharacterized conserved protein [Kurthia zopfii]